MKYLVKTFLLVLLQVVVLRITAQDIKSRWTNTPVVVDGNSSDWPQPFTYYNSSTKLEYAIANDTANIYVCIRVTDEHTSMRLFRSGMNMWFDTKGKKKETTGIGFPLKASMSGADIPKPEGGEQRTQEGGGEQPTYRKHDLNDIRARIVLHQVNMKLTGFFGITDQVMPLKNGYGITAAFAWDSLNILCIEYKIPIALVLRHSLSTADTNNAIGLGMVESALEGGSHTGGDGGGWNGSNTGMNRGTGMGGMNGGMGGGGMNGGMGGGGMGGGGRGGGMGGGNMGGGNYSTANQEQKMWTRILLAYMQ